MFDSEEGGGGADGRGFEVEIVTLASWDSYAPCAAK